MSQPAVNISELDGALGVLPPTAGRPLAVIGHATSGPTDLPAAFGRPADLVSNYTSGTGVEASAGAIERTGRPAIFVRCAASVAGSEGTLNDDAVGGTSEVTLESDNETVDNHELYFEVTKAGTIGTAGIEFVWSLDGGRTKSPPTALGTATEFEFPGTGGVTISFGAGTLLLGDTVTTRTSAPTPSTSDLAAALDALIASTIDWELVLFAFPITPDLFDTIETKMAAATAAGKDRAWVGNVRVPNVGESEATYLASVAAAFASKSTTYGELCAGACELTSSISGRKYLRPAAFVVGALEAGASEEVNIADVNLGAVRGVSIRDANGNAKHHDESLSPGLDDARFTVLRTHSEFPGVYVNRPRVFSAAGSDFQLLTHRRVMNLAKAALRVYFKRRLNKRIRVSASTGRILEREALEMEAGATALLSDALLAKPKASGVIVSVSRFDNLLGTKTLNVQCRVVPLSYPEFIEIGVGFYNPALQLQQVAA